MMCDMENKYEWVNEWMRFSQLQQIIYNKNEKNKII